MKLEYQSPQIEEIEMILESSFAMTFGKPIIAFDVIYNRETTENKTYYFKDSNSLIELLNQQKDGTLMKEVAMRRYTWKLIAKQYKALY